MRSSIILKIFISFLLVSLLPIAALIAYNDWANRGIVYKMKMEDIKKNAEKLAKSIDRDISLKKERITQLSKICCLSECSKITNRETMLPDIKHRLKQFFKCLTPMESVFVLDKNGKVIITNIDNLPEINYSSRNFFKEAKNGVPFVSEPMMDKGEGYMYCSASFKNCNREIMCVLVMRYKAQDLWKIIEEEKDSLGKGSLCILTDGYGVRIAHATDRNLIFKSWIMLDPEVEKKLERERHYGEDITEIGYTEIPEVAKALTQSGGLYITHSLVVNAENNHGYCLPLKEKDWKLIYTVPATTFLAQVKHLTQNAMFSTGIVFVVVVTVTWLLSVKLLRPIKRLKYAANEIANGNLEHPITNGGRDEISDLMRAFNVMRHKLKSSYKNLKDSHIETVLTLARACEVRDEDTGGHVLRIQHYSMLLAGAIGLNELFVWEVGHASILHDVGKIHMPDSILLRKSGGLTHEERELIKNHPLHGEKILGGSSSLQLAREIARWHHENWDGTGYPDGLKGEEIPISARIVRMADVWDALVTKRYYKDAWTDQRAYGEIVKYSGVYFDPKVVEDFKILFARGLFPEVRNKYA